MSKLIQIGQKFYGNLGKGERKEYTVEALEIQDDESFSITLSSKNSFGDETMLIYGDGRTMENTTAITTFKQRDKESRSDSMTVSEMNVVLDVLRGLINNLCEVEKCL